MSSFYNNNNNHKNSYQWLSAYHELSLTHSDPRRQRLLLSWLGDKRAETQRVEVICPRSHCCLVEGSGQTLRGAGRCLWSVPLWCLGSHFVTGHIPSVLPLLDDILDYFHNLPTIRPYYWSWEGKEPRVTFSINHWLKTISWGCVENKKSHQQGTEGSNFHSSSLATELWCILE